MSTDKIQPADTTPAPVETDDTAELLKFAAEADKAAAEGQPSPKFEEKPAATAAPDKGKAAEPGDKGKVDTKAAKPGDKPADKPEDKPGDKKPEDKKSEDSEFTKAKKEQDRQKEVLAGFQKEKEAFRQEKVRIESELTTLRNRVAELTKKPAGPAKDKNGLTADDYDQLAKDYEKEGKDGLAAGAKERAAELRKQPEAQPDKPAATAAFTTPEFQTEWKKNVQQLIDTDPELAKPDNPVVRAANLLVNHELYGRFFRSAPDGIHAAVEVAKIMQTGAKATADLKTATEELATAKAEIDRLTKLTQPQGSHPAGPAPGDKKPEDMSDDEIMAAARAADRAQTPG